MLPKYLLLSLLSLNRLEYILTLNRDLIQSQSSIEASIESDNATVNNEGLDEGQDDEGLRNCADDDATDNFGVDDAIDDFADDDAIDEFNFECFKKTLGL
jgi:hypothetical protein